MLQNAVLFSCKLNKLTPLAVCLASASSSLGLYHIYRKDYFGFFVAQGRLVRRISVKFGTNEPPLCQISL